MSARPVPERTLSIERPDGHRLHVEDSGPTHGPAALFLHGGPGGTLGSGYLRIPDLERWRVIGLQQRGAGASTPHASAAFAPEEYTTARQVADIEAVREHLGIEDWVVQGVSWGSTLALHYALTHPKRVRALVLVAVTTTSPREVQWITEGVGAIYPKAFEEFSGYARTRGWQDGESLVEAYARAVLDPDPALAHEAADQWMRWEQAHVSLGATPGAPNIALEGTPEFRLAFARQVTHAWSHHGFAVESGLARDGDVDGILPAVRARLAHLPAALIHGRRDVSGPAVTAWRLHQALPLSTLSIIEEEGHGGPHMSAAWKAAMAALLDG